MFYLYIWDQFNGQLSVQKILGTHSYFFLKMEQNKLP